MQTVNGYIEGNTVVMVDEPLPQILNKDFIVHIVEKAAPKSEKKISREKLLDIMGKYKGSFAGTWGENVDDYIKTMREDRELP